MAKKSKPPVIVAELGRPETPSETAARKALDSRNYRERKTVNNLVFSLLVSLGLVLLMVLIVPRGVDQFSERSIDAVELAEAAAPSAGRHLAAPVTDEGWKAKQAELRGDSRVSYWQINYTTADEAYAAVVHAYTPDGSPVSEDWVATQLESQNATGTEEIGGLTWTVYDHPDRHSDDTNVRFAMQTEYEGDTILVYGTDSAGTMRVLASQVADSLVNGTEQAATQNGAAAENQENNE